MTWMDKENTYAIVVGTEEYRADDDLHDLEAASNNAWAFFKKLKSPIIGLPKKNVTKLLDEDDKRELEEALYSIKETPKVKNLIVYYSGHGVLDDNDELFLTFRKTRLNRIHSDGFKIQQISDILSGKKLNIILILDCCFSERAFAGLTAQNFYAIASSAQNKASKYPTNQELSCFTMEFLTVLEKGIDNDKEALTLDDIFEAVKNRLKAKNLPIPKRASRNEVANLWFATNENKGSGGFDNAVDIDYLEKIFAALKVHDPTLVEKRRKLPHAQVQHYKGIKKLILEAYPSVIAYHLKNLLPDLEDVNLAYLQYFYQQILRFLSFILLADLNRFQKEKTAGLNLKINVTHADNYQMIKQVLEAQSPVFLEEFADKKEAILAALANLEALLGKENVYADFKKGLVELLVDLAFLTNYNLLSVRFIDVLKRFANPDKFRHEVSVLKGESPKAYSKEITLDMGYFHSNSVLLFKGKNVEDCTEKSDYLNLWPMLIDVSSFSPKNNTPEIHFFQKKDAEKYWYQEVKLRKENQLKPYDHFDDTLTKQELERHFLAFEKNFL